MRAAIALVTLLSVGGCDGEEVMDAGADAAVGPRGTEGCDNLLPACLYPFPSDAYVADGHVRLPDPLIGGRRPFATSEITGPGFGAASPIVFQLPGAVAPGPGPFDGASGLSPDSPTVVIDRATGERVPHWVETDFRSPDVDPPLLVIRTSVPLPRGTEIVVGVRGLEDERGAVVDAPEAFAALRDGEPTDWIGVDDRRARFDEVVFPTLEAAGFERASLQLAWSFPVRADEDAVAPLLAVRDAIFAALPSAGPAYVIDAILECDGADDPPDCHPDIRLIVDGTVDVPSVTGPADELGVRRTRRGADGAPVVDGVERWPFRLQLPHAAFDGPAPVPVMQYGHGFLGSADEANNGWLRRMANRLGFAILACDMQGMNMPALEVWTQVFVNDVGRLPHVQDLAHQGVVNQLVQQRLVRTSLAADPEPRLRRADGQLAWDATVTWYYGNSQGGSVGTVVTALSVDVERSVLGVPGSHYPLLLHRAVQFEQFEGLFTINYREPDINALFLSLLGTAWDPFDPLTFAPHLNAAPLPGTPAHDVLYHVAKEDRQVVNEASFISARAAGAVLLTPAVRPVFALPEEPYPSTRPVTLVEYDFGVPDDPTPLDVPDGDPSLPDGGDTHEWLRRDPRAQDQMVHFLRTGETIDVCGGEPCRRVGPP